MENVHRSSVRPWISDSLNVKEFRDRAYEVQQKHFDIRKEIHVPDVEERMQKFTKSPEKLKRVAASCSIDLLECPDEEYVEFCEEFKAPEDNELVTLRIRENEVSKMNSSVAYRNLVLLNMKYHAYNKSLEFGPKKRNLQSSKHSYEAIEHPEVVLNVQCFRPVRYIAQEQQKAILTKTASFSVDQEFMVLGSQFLTTLRDHICCPSDISIPGDLSEDPETEENFHCADMYKSGFLYINEVFYNDMRDPFNKDYSKPIIEWSRDATGIGPFRCEKMEETRFIDLTLKLGYPYVYQHQGHCEHLFVFSNIRLMTSADNQNAEDYPLLQIMQPQKRIFCMACHIYIAKWITYGDKRLPETPYFFCENCFKSFNYDVNGKKIADFKAYKYFDRSSLF